MGDVNMQMRTFVEVPLAGDYHVGDRVVSLIDFASGNSKISVGDIGIVLGPCSDPTASAAFDRVNCKFDGHHAGINLDVATQIVRYCDQELAGNFCVGFQVVSLMSFEKWGSKVFLGDVGTVIGPCADPAAPDAKERVH